MMRTLKQRVLVTLIATIIAAACGVLCGGVLGCYVTLMLTERRLVKSTASSSAKADIRLAESGAVLAAMRGSSYRFCSDAELTYFRALLFEAKYLKDVGRMRDGRIDCSADLGHLSKGLAMPHTEVATRAGTLVYKNPPPYENEDQDVVALQESGFYVVYIPNIQLHSEPGLESYSETLTDTLNGPPFNLLGESPRLSGAILSRNGHDRSGNGLYATHCSPRYLDCITASISIPEALRADRTQIRIYTTIGGLTGAFLGLFCAIAYRRNRSIDHQLRRAIRRDRLRVVYQPVVDLVSKQIVGAEALARWTDEEGFAVGPEIFVAIAEECGFVGKITRLVLRHALRDFAETLRNNPEFRLNINVAAADMSDPEFLPMLDHSLQQAGVSPLSLGLELTESSTARQDLAMETIRQLRQRGHSVQIDDFGTGYSSLSYLHALSIDTIKIDRSFTQAIGTESVTVGILPQILAMAEALGLGVIVEGIETTRQAAYFALAEMPILAQGWLFGRPVSAAEFHRWLAEDAKKKTPTVVDAA